MIIESIHVKRFRGFLDSNIKLGKHLTVIAGQNGTQKSTLLGMITQPLTINDPEHPMFNEVPLCGGNFKSAFQSKFRLSPKFDRVKEHEWTLSFCDGQQDYTLESIYRDKAKNLLRFWKKGDKSVGSGYVQVPTIFLSLKRLIPIGEEKKIESNQKIKLDENEQEFFIKEYKKILLTTSESIENLDYIQSRDKQTLGVTTSEYDWHTNSAGQDNVAKIILAVMSFRRLKKAYGVDYKGGVLAIDELDATLFPASQVKVVQFILRNASRLNIQVVCTTHSLTVIKEIEPILRNKSRKEQVKLVYLKKVDGVIKVDIDPEYERVLNNLKVALSGESVRKVPIYFEDAQARDFARSIIGNKFKVELLPLELGCNNLIELGRKNIFSFSFPNSIVVLDGDARSSLKRYRLENFICLPSEQSPEQLIATYLYSLLDTDDFWTEKRQDYTKQRCFINHLYQEIMTDRNKAKEWYEQQVSDEVWGRRGAFVYSKIKKEYSKEVSSFISKFSEIYKKCL